MLVRGKETVPCVCIECPLHVESDRLRQPELGNIADASNHDEDETNSSQNRSQAAATQPAITLSVPARTLACILPRHARQMRARSRRNRGKPHVQLEQQMVPTNPPPSLSRRLTVTA